MKIFVTGTAGFIGMHLADVPVTFADVSKARKKLGYDPSTPISKGLSEFVKWYKEYFNR